MIGIISGMGAFAGNNLLTEINRRAVQNAPAGLSDADFPEVLLHQVPFRASTHLGDADIDWLVEDIADSARKMEAFGVDTITFACNTHDRVVQKAVETTTAATYQSITGALHQKLRNDPATDVLYLVSDRQRRNKAPVLPGKTIHYPDQIAVNRLIKLSIAGKLDTVLFQEAIRGYPEHLIVLGCTELYPYAQLTAQPVVDSLITLAERILP